MIHAEPGVGLVCPSEDKYIMDAICNQRSQILGSFSVTCTKNNSRKKNLSVNSGGERLDEPIQLACMLAVFSLVAPENVHDDDADPS